MGLRSIWRNWKKSRQLKRQIENATGENYFQLINWWETEEVQHHRFRLFIEHYHLNPQKKPIVFFSVFGKREFTKFGKGKIKIFFSGESLQPNSFTWCQPYRDYCLDEMSLSLGYDTLPFDNYYRFPVWIFYSWFKPSVSYGEIKACIREINNKNYRLANKQELKSSANSQFAALLARHDKLTTVRGDLVRLLNQIQSVCCAGKYLHNTDELQTKYQNDKQEYLRQFRFNICPENSNSKGYTTEKIFDAIRAGCIPIYWGSEGCPEPEILNQDAILFYDPDNPDALLQQVRRLESDPEYYAEFISRPPFKEDAADKIWQMIDGLRDKLEKVINQH